MFSKKRFTTAVLASSLFFIGNVAKADYIVFAPELNAIHNTQTDGNISIVPGGSLAINGGEAVAAVVLNSSNTLTLDGPITAAVGAFFAPVEISGTSSGSQIINNSTIQTQTVNPAIGVIKTAINALSDFNVINNETTGQILAVSDNAGIGINLNATDGALSGTINNKALGMITAKAVAIKVSKTFDGSINNVGTITATGAAANSILVDASLNRGIFNNAGGIIQSTTGIGINITLNGTGTITNSGNILSNGGAFQAIKIQGPTFTITNNATGVIQSIASSGIEIVPSVPLTKTTGSLTNNGSILGVTDGVKVSGRMVGGITNDNIITASNGVGIRASADISTGIINTTAGVVTGTNFQGILIQSKTNVTNDGKIQALVGGSGMSLSAGAIGVLTNNLKGEIFSAAADGVDIAGSITYDINNAGLISGSVDGVFTSDTSVLTGTLTNTGIIRSNTAGVGIRALGTITGGIINSGTVTGLGNPGILISAATVNSVTNITNSNIIQSNTDGIKVDTKGSSSISNTATGIIRATAAGGRGLVYSGLNANPATLSNAGQITGFTTGSGIEIDRIVNGAFTNTGTVISPTGPAINLGIVAGAGFSGGFINSGSVTGADGIRSSFAASSMNITNQASGTITGNAVGGAAINVDQAFISNILNQGIIQNTSISGNAILINNPLTGSITNDTTGLIKVNLGADAIVLNANLPVGTTIVNNGTVDAGTAGFVFKAAAGIVGDFTNTAKLIGNVQMGAGTFILNPGSNFSGLVQGNNGFLSGFTLNPGAGNTFTSTGITDKIGTIDVQSGTYVLNHPITNGDVLNVHASAILQLNNNVALNGAGAITKTLRNLDNGQIQLTKAVTLIGALEQTGIGGRVAFTVFDPTNFGQINLNSTINLTNTGFVEIKIGDGYFPNGQTFDVIKGAAAVLSETSQLIAPTSALVSFTKTLNGNDVRITANRKAMSNLSNPQTKQLADVLEQIGINGTLDPQFRQVLGQLSNAATPDILRNGLEALADEVNGARRSVVSSTNARFGTLISDRLNLVRNDLKDANEAKGYAAGDLGNHRVGWVQGFGAKVQQKVRKNIPGYEARTTGIGAGLDVEICPKLMIGVDAGYARSGVNSANATRHETQIKTYLLGAYGSLIDNIEYTDFQFTFGTSQYDTTRNVVVGILNQKAKGDFGGFQFDTRVAHGWMKSWLDWRVTPEAFAQYEYIATKGYIESGAGALNLRVDNQSHNVLELGANVRMDYPYETEFGRFVPGFNVGLMWDAFRQRQSSTTSFVGGGTSFINNGAKPAITAMLLGAGFVMETKQNLDVQVKADLIKKNTYNSASFIVTMRYKM